MFSQAIVFKMEDYRDLSNPCPAVIQVCKKLLLYFFNSVTDKSTAVVANNLDLTSSILADTLL